LYNLWLQIYPWLISGIGGFAGAALLLPTKLGEALFQFRVNRALEGFKAQQAKELVEVKERLDHLSDRGRRSNEMEFQAIESVWKAFVKAWLSTNTCIGLMTTVPDFSSMSDEEVMVFGAGSGLDNDEVDALLKADDRQKKYSSILSWQKVNEAGTDIYQARLVLREQRIFMPKTLTEQFAEVIEQMSGAQVQRRLSLQHPDIPNYRFGKAQSDWIQDCVEIFERMASHTNKRLFREEKQE
jgi:hypothetical protein